MLQTAACGLPTFAHPQTLKPVRPVGSRSNSPPPLEDGKVPVTRPKK
jgi:hypothetical protein